MSIQKKSLISSLKTVKKANVAASPATNEGVSTRKTKAWRKAVNVRCANVDVIKMK